MKRPFVLCAALTLLAACSLTGPRSRLPVDPGTGELHFDPPAPERVVLDNGMVIYLLEDHELPLISITGSIRAGSVNDPPERAGLASLTGTLMRTGGIRGMTSDEVDRRLEQMSAHLDVNVGPEQGTATLSVLREDFEAAFDIFARVIMEPVFEQRKIEISRSSRLQSLRQLPDNPQALAFREFKKLLYAGDPRGVQPRIGTINHIRRADMVAFHTTHIRPDAIMLAVSGDFDRADMLGRITSRFGRWQPRPGAGPVKVGPPKRITRTAAYHLPRRLPQSTIVLGQFAPPKTDRDFFAFQVLDFIIGSGGFTSRLFSEIRTTQGLAYSVGSFYRGDTGYGVFGAYCMTKSDTTNRALRLMMDIVDQARNGDLSQGELEFAKESILNNFIFSYTSSAQIAAQQMQLEYEGLPPDFLRTAPEKIRSLTLEDVQRAAAAWLDTGKMIVLTAGDASRFDAPAVPGLKQPLEISTDILKEQ